MTSDDAMTPATPASEWHARHCALLGADEVASSQNHTHTKPTLIPALHTPSLRHPQARRHGPRALPPMPCR
jgi:hypothetical protein